VEGKIVRDTLRKGQRVIPYDLHIFFREVRQMPNSLATAFSGMVKYLERLSSESIFCVADPIFLCSTTGIHPRPYFPYFAAPSCSQVKFGTSVVELVAEPARKIQEATPRCPYASVSFRYTALAGLAGLPSFDRLHGHGPVM
jgi:hypothetical protein